MRYLYVFVVIAFCMVGFSAQADEVRLGALSYQNLTVGNGTYREIIDPADNVAGAKITTGLLYNVGGSITLSAEYPNSTYRFILQGSAVNLHTNTHLPYPIFLPAGVGLSVIGSDTTQAGCHITYDLISN
jgi:hypothetical protein